jgi:ribosomal protein S18 acetylase RimI-like enzyme
MATFNCILTSYLTVTSDNLPKWRKLLQINTNNLSIAQKKILTRYGVSTIDDYIKLVTTALDNDKVNELNEKYQTALKSDMEQTLKKEKDSFKKKLESSFYKNSNNTVIRMLTEDDESDAIKLYKLFKETMNEDIQKVENDTEDFILKNIMFGIFIEDTLVGFVIIKYSRSFTIDYTEEKTPTFYIQELLIHPNNRGNKLSKYLLQYCIYRCPKNMKYISLMTMPDNIALQKIAESVGFIKQKTISGDKKHSLLMIKNVDKVESALLRLSENSKSS